MYTDGLADWFVVGALRRMADLMDNDDVEPFDDEVEGEDDGTD